MKIHALILGLCILCAGTANSQWGYVSGTDNIYNTDGGNVGIGTTTITARLTVNNSISFSGTGGGNAGNINWGTGSGSAALTLYDGGSGTRYGAGINGYEMQFFIPSATGTHFSFNKGGNLQSSGSNELMRISASGDVGIGTTSPYSRLDIRGGTKALTLDVTNATDNVWEEFTTDHRTYRYAELKAVNYGLNLVLDPNNAFSGYANYSITNGKVGIGTNTPTARLDVAGSTNFTQKNVFNLRSSIWGTNTSQVTIGFDNDNTTDRGVIDYRGIANGYNGNGAVLNVNFQSGSLFACVAANTGIINLDIESPYVYDLNGFVGSGAALRYKLVQANTVGAVYGTFIDITRTAATNPYHTYGHVSKIRNYNEIGYGFYADVTNYSGGTGTTYAFYAASGKSYFADNVGIGITTPDTKLHVSGANSLKYADGNQAAGKVLTSDANGVASWQTPSGGGGGSSQWTTATNDIYSNNSGNVGVGTTTPAEKFHLGGGGNLRIDAGYVMHRQNGRSRYYNNASNNYVEIYNPSMDGSSQLAIVGGPGEVLRIDASGNLGIATSTPSYKLDVNGTVRLNSALFVNSNGTVAVGTVTSYPSGYKLAVAGNIIAEKVRVKLQSTGWPDYVFNDKYPLPSLKETEKFIKQNNHLPGVPSASQIEKEGLDLGDGQAVLLKKIEELTLHLIELDKKVEKLVAENEALKRKEKK